MKCERVLRTPLPTCFTQHISRLLFCGPTYCRLPFTPLWAPLPRFLVRSCVLRHHGYRRCWRSTGRAVQHSSPSTIQTFFPFDNTVRVFSMPSERATLNQEDKRNFDELLVASWLPLVVVDIRIML
jgi:hypothetical protein